MSKDLAPKKQMIEMLGIWGHKQVKKNHELRRNRIKKLAVIRG